MKCSSSTIPTVATALLLAAHAAPPAQPCPQLLLLFGAYVEPRDAFPSLSKALDLAQQCSSSQPSQQLVDLGGLCWRHVERANPGAELPSDFAVVQVCPVQQLHHPLLPRTAGGYGSASDAEYTAAAEFLSRCLAATSGGSTLRIYRDQRWGPAPPACSAPPRSRADDDAAHRQGALGQERRKRGTTTAAANRSAVVALKRRPPVPPDSFVIGRHYSSHGRWSLLTRRLSLLSRDPGPTSPLSGPRPRGRPLPHSPAPAPPPEPPTAEVVVETSCTVPALEYNVSSLWARGANGAGVHVAVLDTGLSATHRHFQGAARGASSSSPVVVEVVDWTDEDKRGGKDVIGHGTFMASQVAGQQGVAEARERAAGAPPPPGRLRARARKRAADAAADVLLSDDVCPGLAPGASLHIYRVFTSSQLSYTSWLLDALNYAMAQGVHVVSLSVGGTDFTDAPFTAKVDEVVAAGIAFVSAAGNDGPLHGTINHPASQVSVLGVGGLTLGRRRRRVAASEAAGATDDNGIRRGDDVSVFSSRGHTVTELPRGVGRMKPDVLGMAQDVCGSGLSGRCTRVSGTSVAAPIIAGAVAVLRSSIPPPFRLFVANPAALRQALMLTAVRTGAGDADTSFSPPLPFLAAAPRRGEEGGGRGGLGEGSAGANSRQQRQPWWTSDSEGLGGRHMYEQGAGAVSVTRAAEYLWSPGRLTPLAATPPALDRPASPPSPLEGGTAAQGLPQRPQHPLEGWVTPFPQLLSMAYGDCPYHWPTCGQPLWVGAEPIVFNVTLLNSVAASGMVVFPPAAAATAVSEGERTAPPAGTVHYFADGSLVPGPQWVPDDAPTPSPSMRGRLSGGAYAITDLVVTVAAPQPIWPYSGWVDVAVSARYEYPPSAAAASAGDAEAGDAAMRGRWDDPGSLVLLEGTLVLHVASNVPPAKRAWLRELHLQHPSAAGLHGSNAWSASGRHLISRVEVRVRAQVSLAAPPRHRRLLWDVYHQEVYPRAFVPRDDAFSRGAGDTEGGSVQLDWNGDHPYTNLRAMWMRLRDLGYAITVGALPWGAPAAKQPLAYYGTLLLIDPETQFTAEELEAVRPAVESAGLSLVVFADWYDPAILSNSPLSRTHDAATGCDWRPVTGGCNIPALNDLLQPFGIEMDYTMVSGDLRHNLSGAAGCEVPLGCAETARFESGTTIALAPEGQLTFSARLRPVGQRSTGSPSGSVEGDALPLPVPVLALVQHGTPAGGRIAVFGDSACIDDAQARGRYCWWVVEAMLSFAASGVRPDAENLGLLPGGGLAAADLGVSPAPMGQQQRGKRRHDHSSRKEHPVPTVAADSLGGRRIVLQRKTAQRWGLLDALQDCRPPAGGGGSGGCGGLGLGGSGGLGLGGSSGLGLGGSGGLGLGGSGPVNGSGSGSDCSSIISVPAEAFSDVIDPTLFVDAALAALGADLAVGGTAGLKQADPPEGAVGQRRIRGGTQGALTGAEQAGSAPSMLQCAVSELFLPSSLEDCVLVQGYHQRR